MSSEEVAVAGVINDIPPTQTVEGGKNEAEVDAQDGPSAVPDDEGIGDAIELRELVEQPQTIGYRTFKNGKECYDYFHNILTKYRKNQDLNEYEHHNVLKLIEKGHPHADRKLVGGVMAFQIRELYVNGRPSLCFHIIHEDGKVEDVSYRKCIYGIYPDMKQSMTEKTQRKN